jgi:hypothetical protein
MKPRRCLGVDGRRPCLTRVIQQATRLTSRASHWFAGIRPGFTSSGGVSRVHRFGAGAAAREFSGQGVAK